jgi:hypothetical protein
VLGCRRVGLAVLGLRAVRTGLEDLVIPAVHRGMDDMEAERAGCMEWRWICQVRQECRERRDFRDVLAVRAGPQVRVRRRYSILGIRLPDARYDCRERRRSARGSSIRPS